MPIFRYYVISLGSNSAVAELVVICVAFHYPKPELRFYLANIPVKLREHIEERSKSRQRWEPESRVVTSSYSRRIAVETASTIPPSSKARRIG